MTNPASFSADVLAAGPLDVSSTWLATTAIVHEWTGEDDGWVAGFADFPPGVETSWNFGALRKPLPAPLTTASRALFIAGDNHSDDLFMFWKRSVTGLQPSTAYSVTIEVTFATNAPKHCPGVGGAPGESVYVKLGMSAEEPLTRVGAGGNVEMTIDKGRQAVGGKDAIVVGDVAGSNRDCAHRRWERKELKTPRPLTVTAGPDGKAWLLVASDSGFEARTELYYERVRLRLEPIVPRSVSGGPETMLLEILTPKTLVTVQVTDAHFVVWEVVNVDGPGGCIRFRDQKTSYHLIPLHSIHSASYVFDASGKPAQIALRLTSRGLAF